MPSDVIADFTAGLWFPEEAAPSTEQPGFAIPRNALLTADNVEYLPSGGVKGRRGRTLYNSVSLGGAVRGLHRHYARQATVSAGPVDSVSQASQNLPTYGGVAWSNPTRAVTLNDSPATVTLTNQVSESLACDFHGAFTIPGGATITGIQVDIARRAKIPSTGGIVLDFDIRMERGTIVPVFMPANRGRPGEPWPTYLTTDTAIPYVYATYGGPGDLWGADGFGSPWTVAEFNTGGLAVVMPILVVFGAGTAVIAEVDHIRMTVFYTDTGNHRFVVAHVSGGNLLYKSGSAGVFSSITGGTVTLPTSRPRFVNWPEKNQTFLFDGLNAVRRYNGSQISVVPTGNDNLTAPKKGPYATLWKDRLFAAAPEESNFSVYASELFDETEWPPEAHVSVNDPQGGTITGLIGLADRLIILKNTNLWSFVGDIEFGPGQLAKYSDEGCVAPDSPALTPWGIVYCGRDGIYLTDGESPYPLEVSRAIRPLWITRTGRNVFPLAVGIYHPRTDRYLINLDPTANVTYALQRLLIPDPRGGEPSAVFAWSKISPLPLNAATVWAGETDQGELYTGDTSGSVFEADVGSTDPSSTNVAIDLLTSQRLFDQDYRRNARIYHIRPLFRAGSPASMALRYDQDLTDSLTFATVGSTPAAVEEQEPRVYVSDKSEFGRFYSARFQHTNAGGGAVELHRIDVDYKLRSRRPWVDPRPT